MINPSLYTVFVIGFAMYKRIIAGILFSIPFYLAADESLISIPRPTSYNCLENDLLFFSYTQNHRDFVQLCRLNNTRFSFTYGDIDNPTVHFGQDLDNIKLLKGYDSGFIVDYGQYSYAISINQYGDASITVNRGTTVIDIIGLDFWYVKSTNIVAKMLKKIKEEKDSKID